MQSFAAGMPLLAAASVFGLQVEDVRVYLASCTFLSIYVYFRTIERSFNFFKSV